MTTKVAFFLFLVFSSFSSFPARAEGLSLSFTEITQPPKTTGSTAAPATEKAITVDIFPKSFVLHAGEGEKIYDFTGNHLFSVSAPRKTFSSFPLYAIPLFLQMEKRNRELMARALTAAKIENMPVESPVDIDMIFGSDKNTTTTLSQTEENGETVFSAEDRRFAGFTLSETAIPERLRASYARFLTYETTLHPAIEKALGTPGKVFSRLHYIHHEATNEEETTWTLTAAKPIPQDEAALPEGLTQVFSEDPRLNAAMARTVSEPKPTVQDFDRKTAAFLAKNESLQTALSVMEMVLALGPRSMMESAVAKDALRKSVEDPMTKETLAYISRAPGDAAQLETAMNKLEAAKKAAPEFVFLLDIYGANHVQSVLGAKNVFSEKEMAQLSSARKALSEGLIASPWLVGAWLDLGNAYYRGFETPAAAQCWEQAARLSPGNPALQGIERMQLAIRQDFPEYFIE